MTCIKVEMLREALDQEKIRHDNSINIILRDN